MARPTLTLGRGRVAASAKVDFGEAPSSSWPPPAWSKFSRAHASRGIVRTFRAAASSRQNARIYDATVASRRFDGGFGSVLAVEFKVVLIYGKMCDGVVGQSGWEGAFAEMRVFKQIV